MRDARRRLERLESSRTYRQYQQAAAEYGLDADELWAEGEAFFAMPLAEQLAEVDILAEHFTAEELAHIRSTLIRATRPI